MRWRTASATLSGVRKARDTVIALTPARRATSCMVTRPARVLRGFRMDIGRSERLAST